MLLSDILGQASDHHSIIGGGMPPVLLPWRPETIRDDSVDSQTKNIDFTIRYSLFSISLNLSL